MFASENQHNFNENPIDCVVSIAKNNHWPFTQHADDEASFVLQGKWKQQYDLGFFWHEDMHALQLCCTTDLAVPAKKMEKMRDLLVAINRQSFLGFFDVAEDDNTLVYRYTSLLTHMAGDTQAHVEEIVDIAVNEADRFMPALLMVLQAKGEIANDLITTAIFDHAGEA